VVGQIALSLALLTTAGLFMRGAVRAGAADPGFPLDGGLVASVDPALARYDETRGRAAFAAVLQRARMMPGVHAASLASLVPFGEFQEGHLVQKAGTPPAPEGQRDQGVDATYTVVGSDYFETLRIAVLRGRGFTASEEASPTGPLVAVIDEPLARQLFGTEDAIGQRIQWGRDEQRARHYEIVGVVGGVRHQMFDKVPGPHLYVPFGQHYRGGMQLHVRLGTGGEAAEAAMMNALRQEIRAVDAGLPVIGMKSLRQHRDRSIMLWAVNSGARMFAIFGAVALLLAVVGVYGVKAYVVSRRTREIGIRMALGASAPGVLRMVLSQGARLGLAGIALGLLGGFALARAMASLLYGVTPADPATYAGVALLMLAVALAASGLPAWRATRVDPIRTLKAE
jgi:predicted permease